MATTPAYRPDPQTKVKIGERLWSQEVAAADPRIAEPETSYRFSNGREFKRPSNPYEQYAEPPVEE